MRLNKTKTKKRIRTYEGAPASKGRSPAEQLRRIVACSLLWEDQFYVDGKQHAEWIRELVPRVDSASVVGIAEWARTSMKLRHTPLLIVREMARHNKHKKYVADTLYEVINRPDELTEFLAIYWQNGKEPLSAQVKKGLARAFTKFDAYQLAKYNRKSDITLRDVMFLTHPKPKDAAQALAWKDLVEGTLAPPDTWEVALSAKDGVPARAKWERLINDGKLGAMAVLRNLRNMQQAGVHRSRIRKAITSINPYWVLPFRFISAAKYAPDFEPQLEQKLFESLQAKPKFKGDTIILVDASGSMDANLSGRSEITRYDAACGVAMIVREMAENAYIYVFSDATVPIKPRRGFALRDELKRNFICGTTYLGSAINYVEKILQEYDRFVVITDEQSHDEVPAPRGLGYMINVGAYDRGVGYDDWLHIHGWSEAVVDYISLVEKEGYNE